MWITNIDFNYFINLNNYNLSAIDNLSNQISYKAKYNFNEELFKLKIAKIRIHLQSLSEDDLEKELIPLYKGLMNILNIYYN